MTESHEKIEVRIKYNELEKTFFGTTQEVWLSLEKFFSHLVPTFDIAKKLLLNVDLQELVQDCEGLIGFSKEGVTLLVPRSKLTDNETLCLRLLASYVGRALGLLPKDTVSREELQETVGKSGKITSTRLGELLKNDIAIKTLDEEYRITTLGVVQMRNGSLPKIKAKNMS